MKIEVELDDQKIAEIVRAMCRESISTSGYGSGRDDNSVVKELRRAVLNHMKGIDWSACIADSAMEVIKPTVEETLKAEIAKETRRQVKKMRDQGEFFVGVQPKGGDNG